MKPRRLILATGLWAALLAVAASSATAVVFSPPAVEFGSQPIMTKSPGQTFTLTKQGPFEALAIFLVPDEFKGSSNINGFEAISNCPEMLTDSVPSCTLTVHFTPYLRGGPQGTTIFTDGTDVTKPRGRVTAGPATRACTKKQKKSNARIRYKKKCKGFPFYDPTDYSFLREAGAPAP